MKRIQYSLLIIFISIVSVTFAQRGKNGNGNIITSNRIVNEYTALTADAAAGSTSISVTASGLNANNRFPGILVPGDLIMIIQMQGATILGQPDAGNPVISDPNDATWGSVTNYNNCGNYEFCQVSSVPDATTITIDCGLAHNYTANGKVQVIRVPRYNTLHISASGSLTCSAWNGIVGGVLSVEVYGNTTIAIGGKVNVTGKGFRGGALFVPTNPVETVLYSCSNTNVGTNKGEGIAGFDTDYNTFGGKYGRGAAANAGGGGNVWNCGGGGGANAGTLASWTGQGNPDNSGGAGWTTAWELEATGFSSSASSGGGRGGYSFTSSNQNATNLGPGTLGITNAWGGSFRYNLGGLGGRPLDYSTGKIFLGGGGGAGEQDNGQAGAGAVGGGIIYFNSYGTITGSGTDSIIANGNNGGNSQATPPSSSYSGKDGSGGGGGGGTIVWNSIGMNGVLLNASGGNGGNQMMASGTFFFGSINEAEGPGGGGGGGYIAVSTGTVTQLVNGGSNGTTNSDGLTEFLPNGATKGGAGFSNQTISFDSITAGNITICSGNTATLNASLNGSLPATINWYNSSTGGTSIGTGSPFTTPVLSANTTFYVGFCPGTYRIPVVVTVQPSTLPSVIITANPSGTVCPGTPVTFTATPTDGGSSPLFQWQLNGNNVGTNSPTYTNSGLVNGDSVKCILLSNSTCISGSPVAVSNLVVMTMQSNNIAASVSITSHPFGTICSGTPVTFIAAPVNGGGDPSYQWQVNGVNIGPDSSTFVDSVFTTGDVVTCIMTSNLTCATGSPATSNSLVITVQATVPVSVSITQNPLGTLCAGTPITFTAVPTNGGSTPIYQWQVNGVNAGTNSSTFTNSTLNNGDMVTCIMTSNVACPTGSPATSNSVVLAVQPSAVVSVNIAQNPTGAICFGTPVTFTATPANGGTTPTYQWQVNGINVGTNSTAFTSSTLNNGDIVTCILTSNATCVTGSPANSNTIIESVNPIPTPDFIAGTLNGCTPVCVQFSETSSTNCNSVFYDFGDGSSSVTPSPQHCYTTAGIYSVSISCTSNNCTGTANHTNMINISSLPVADFTISPADIALLNSSITFTDGSTNGGNQLWDFGDPLSGANNVSVLSSPSHTFADTGTYCVRLVSTNTNSCTDTIIRCIQVLNDATIVIPNVFTPNGDGKNDVFTLSVAGIKELECSIFDRWGLKMKEWNSITGSWDGRSASGVIAADGVYYYSVKATAINGKVIKEQGFLQLLKEK